MRRAAGMMFAVMASAMMIASAEPASSQEGARAHCASAHELDAAPTRIRDGDASALASFLEAPECHHWIAFYFAAEKLFEHGDRDEAVGWFYAGQIRGRTVAALDPGSTGMMVNALQYVVGQPINEYAGGDRQKWLAGIDWASEWDRAHPLDLRRLRGLGESFDFSGGQALPLRTIAPAPTPAQFESVYAEQRAGMAQLRASIAAVPDDEWRRMRRENGLE